LQIITAVGLDHTEILGDTLAKITAEKCGILRPGCTLLTSPGQEQEVLTTMLNICADLDATFVTGAAGKAKLVSEDVSGMDILVGKTELSLSLGGKHQINNLLTVYSAVSILREKHFVIKDEHLVEGIAATKFPARFELCSKEPVVILDGAHNPQAAKALAVNVDAFLPKKRTLLCGMMADKDCETVMAELAPHFEHVITVPVQNPRMVKPEELAKLAAKYCGSVEAKENAKEALAETLENLKDDEALVVAGSLYLASELRPMLMKFKGNPNVQ
jgi:dihydrofolate synthase/folylpolyglutamate synthase